MKLYSWLRLMSGLVILSMALAGCSTKAPAPPTIPFQLADSIFAEVGQKGTSNGNTLPYTIVFEESHDSRVGQIEIAIMLNRLYHKYGLRHIALEGAVLEDQAPSAAWFHALSDANIKREVALELLSQGEISAAEFAAMVFPDLQLHPIENKADYQVEMSKDANYATAQYLLAIAMTSLSSDQTAKAKQLMDQNKQSDAFDYIINSNPWTKQRYELLQRTSPSPSIEELITLTDEVEAKAQEVNADVSDYKSAFQEVKNFYATAAKRSETMVGNTVPLAKDQLEAPVAIEIGAAHTSEVTKLFEKQSMSFVVLSPLALSEDSRSGDLYSAAYDRKLKQISIDPAGTLGAFLDGRRKPPPVLNQEWFQLKANIMYVGIKIARAAAVAGGSGKPPFGLNKEAFGLGDSNNIDIDFTAMVSQKVTRKDGSEAYEVTFPIKLLKEGKTVFMKVAQIAQTSQTQTGLSEEQTLEQALTAILAQVEAEKAVDSDQANNIETKHSSENPSVVQLSIDVKAVFSNNSNALNAVPLS